MDNLEALKHRLEIHRVKKAHKELKKKVREERMCSVPDCPRKHQARGYCTHHYCQVIRIYPGQTKPRGLRVAPEGYYNPNGKKALTEEEFCQLKELRENGMEMRDIAFELQKHESIVRVAFEHETFYRYEHRNEWNTYELDDRSNKGKMKVPA